MAGLHYIRASLICIMELLLDRLLYYLYYYLYY
jgi:hypothetical protein